MHMYSKEIFKRRQVASIPHCVRRSVCQKVDIIEIYLKLLLYFHVEVTMNSNLVKKVDIIEFALTSQNCLWTICWHSFNITNCNLLRFDRNTTEIAYKNIKVHIATQRPREMVRLQSWEMPSKVWVPWPRESVTKVSDPYWYNNGFSWWGLS